MSDLALKLIAENKAAHERGEESCKRLDIGNCGLTDLPEKLFELDWLEELYVSDEWCDLSTDLWNESKNRGPANRFSSIPEEIKKLVLLKNLIVIGVIGEVVTPWQISDCSPLAELTNLQSLILHSTQISDCSPLAKLVNLQLLEISYTQVSDCGPLVKLTNLESLFLHGTQVDDCSPLAKLTNLQSLGLSCTKIRDCGPLAHLTNLQWLDLSHTQISDCTPLAKLTNLQSLDLSRTKIRDCGPLAELTNLQWMDLNGTQIRDCDPLLNFSNLKYLDLSETKISKFPKFLFDLKNLEELSFHGTPITDVPVEIINQGHWSNSNCLTDARNYFRSLEKGTIPNNEVKLLLLGNGRVGKSSLVKAMVDRTFDESEISTDKVELRTWSLPVDNPESLKGLPLQVNIWDFGGQEIYYTTHRLFLRTKALFLLVWDKATEDAPTHEDGHGHVFENFKLLHWLDYIRTASQGPVIVVQNKVDTRKDKYTGYEQLLKEHYDKIFDFQYVSAKTDHKEGLPELQKCIKDAYGELPEVGQLIGQQWVAVKERLRELQGNRSISYDEYLTICHEEGLEGTEHETLINLLHNTGFLYFFQHLDEPKIILDQQWAIDAVYAVLKRSNSCYQKLRHYNRHGFTADDLDRYAWHDTYPPEEQQELLKFMVDTQTCFEFTEGVYIAPQLLSKDHPPQIDRRREWREPHGPAIKFRYPFLHMAIIERFIVQAGRMVREEDPIIWRNGIAIYDETCNTDALVEANLENREIRVLTHGDQPLVLTRKIIGELRWLHEEYEPELLFSADGGTHFVLKEKLEESYRNEAKKVTNEAGESIDIKPLLPFLNLGREERLGRETEKDCLTTVGLREKRMEPEKPIVKCFISYAHAYQDHFKVFRDDFEAATANLPFCDFKIWTDEKIPLGDDWHEAIQKAVANCDIAVLLVSDQFMNSEYIKKEEVARLFDRKATEGTLVVPVYFYPCFFHHWPVLRKNQLFKPKGADFGRAELDETEEFTFSDLVELNNVNGKNIAQTNPHRSRYMMRFVEALENQLQEIVGRKTCGG